MFSRHHVDDYSEALPGATREGRNRRFEEKRHEVRFGFLGTVALWRNDAAVRLATKRSRAVMARLLLAPGRPVSIDSLVDCLYGDTPAKSARNQVHRGVGELRTQGVSIVESNGAYLLETTHAAIDAWRFEELTDQARAAARPEDTIRLLGQAMKLWRGSALDGLDTDVFRVAAGEWEERRLTSMEWWVDARLALGHHDDLIPGLQRLAGEHPLRERFHAQLMLACYRAGRTGDSIAAYAALRDLLGDELGVDPSVQLQQLYERILRQEAILNSPGTAPRQLPSRPARLVGRTRELRRIHLALDGGCRALAITGVAGSGKTTLALEVAHSAAERFPDGQLYSSDPENVPVGILRALGETHVPDLEEERNGRLRTLLADRRVLILLENVTSAAQVRPIIPAGEGSALITTSRSSLTSLRDAVQITLGELPHEDAWALLAAGAGAHRLAAEPAATHLVIEWCGGLPLALDIIAAKLAAKTHWSVADLAARLSDDDRILAELRHDDLDIRSALDHGYHALCPTSRALLRKIGYYGNTDISATDLSRLADVPVAEVERLVESLIDAQIIKVSRMVGGGEYSYRCTGMILAHARERALVEDPVHELGAAVERAVVGADHTDTLRV